MKKRIGLLGGRGRMGRMVSALLSQEYGKRAVTGPVCGRNDSFEPLLESDAIIDFSCPRATLALLQWAEPGALPPLVSGTTGWLEEERRGVEDLAKAHRVLLAANFATGILALQWILQQAAPLLQRLGYTPVLTETHHRHKKDAPSGTAKLLQRIIAPEDPDSVQTLAVRAGEVIGEHQVCFFGPADRIVIGHQAQDRGLFARGAIEAALWFSEQPPAGRVLGMADFFEATLAKPL